MVERHIDLTGQTFGRLTVLKRNGKDKDGSALWLCECVCGRFVTVRSNSLRFGKTQSCGCIARERRTTHNMSKTRIYDTWHKMKSRCNNPNIRSYKDYGGRGILVCKEWNDNFASFYQWAITHGYDETLTIDRIDVNANYTPDNCRWVSKSAQATNRRSNRYIEYNGEKKTVTEWANDLNIPRHLLFGRLRRGWSPQDVLTKPLQATKSRKLKEARS